MKLYFRSFVIFLVALSLSFLFSSCSDEESGTVVGSYTSDGRLFSPNTVQVEVMLPYLKDLKVKVVRLNYGFEPMDTLEAKSSREYPEEHSSYFQTDNVDFSSPYVRIVVTGEIESLKQEVTFENLLDISRTNYLVVDFFAAVASLRVEKLMKSGVSWADAFERTKSRMAQQVKPLSLDMDWGFILCEGFVSDSAYYRNFLELRDELAKDSLDFSTLQVRAADAMLERYVGFKWTGELPYTLWSDVSFDFMKNVYNFKTCNYESKGTYDTVKVSKSKFAGTVLMCDAFELNYSYEIKYGYRNILERENELAVCLYSGVVQDTLLVGDSVYYCRKGEWEFESDKKIADGVRYNRILNETYGGCGDSVRHGILRFYNDTLFRCLGKYGTDGYRRIWSFDSSDVAYYETPEGMKSDSYKDARAALENGTCNKSREGEKIKLTEDEFFICKSMALLLGGEWSNGWSPINRIDYYAGTCDDGNVGHSADVPTDSTTLSLVCDYQPPLDVAYNKLNNYGWVPLEWYLKEHE